MKVLEVRPGNVVHNSGMNKWEYTYYLVRPDKKVLRWSKPDYTTANSAKQAMREKVAHERKRHGLLESASQSQ